MNKENLKEFTLDARVLGPERRVQFTEGDTIVALPALIIHGVSAADAWQILGLLDQGLFEAGDPELEEEKVKDEPVETAVESPKAAKPPKEKKARKSKAKQRAEERAAKEEETEPEEEKVTELPKAEKRKTKKVEKSAKVGGLDLEQFKSATGIRNLVADFKEAGIESVEEVIEYCNELNGMGLKCLKGVNIDRRVKNLWTMVA